MHRFKDLEVWKLSRVFCTDIYLTTSKFPVSERFGITNQLHRASISIPSNIAEGSSRSSNKDFSRFLEIAVGSAHEIETQLLISSDLGFLNEQDLELLTTKLDIIVRMIVRFRSTLSPIQQSNI